MYCSSCLLGGGRYDTVLSVVNATAHTENVLLSHSLFFLLVLVNALSLPSLHDFIPHLTHPLRQFIIPMLPFILFDLSHDPFVLAFPIELLLYKFASR